MRARQCGGSGERAGEEPAAPHGERDRAKGETDEEPFGVDLRKEERTWKDQQIGGGTR